MTKLLYIGLPTTTSLKAYLGLNKATVLSHFQSVIFFLGISLEVIS